MKIYVYEGTRYGILGELKFKHPSTREWIPAFRYARIDANGKATGDQYVREKSEFLERFQEIKVSHGWARPKECMLYHFFVNGKSLCPQVGTFYGELHQKEDAPAEQCQVCNNKKSTKGIIEWINQIAK
jgi:hypothetical protein